VFEGYSTVIFLAARTTFALAVVWFTVALLLVLLVLLVLLNLLILLVLLSVIQLVELVPVF
jgi:hypothetical protein